MAAIFCLLVSIAGSGQEIAVRRDTQFPVEVRHTINASKARIGDPVEFRTQEAVLIGNNVVVPGNAKIFGTITEIRRTSPGSPSVVRIRIHTLKWKNRQAPLNAVIQSIQRIHTDSARWTFRHTPTFLEGIRVVSYLQRDAYTEFTCEKKDVKIRSGLEFLLRQVDVRTYPEREYTVYSPEDDRTAGW